MKNIQKFVNERALFYLASLIMAAFFSIPTLALDLKLKDRLKTPAKHFDHLENTSFLAIEKVGDRLITAGERGVIGVSDDSGKTWKQADVPVSVLITALHFPSEILGWAVGHSGTILQSVDRGETWALVLDGVQINEMLVRYANESLEKLKIEFAAADEFEQEDLQYAVEDAEFALSNAKFDSELGPANPFLDVLFLDDKKGFAVGAYGLFVMTYDGGVTWQSIAHRLENFDRYHLNAIGFIKGGALLIAGEAGTLFVSYDEGESWETLYGPYQGSFFGIQPTESSGEAFLYGLKGHVFKTPDGAQSWQRISVGVETTLTSSALSFENELVIAGLSGVVLMSDDGGETFKPFETKGFEGFNGVSFSPNGNLVLVSDEGIQSLNPED